MSEPTPKGIRDRLARVETLLQDISTAADNNLPVPLTVQMAVAKSTILQAAATTLLVEQQERANLIATAQVWATMGESRTAREILSDPRLRE